MPASDRPAFFCDSMLGRLAKWLRLMGYDAAYQRQIGDWEMLRRCAAEKRVLLTRDRGVMKRWQIGRGYVPALLVSADDVASQLEQVATAYGLRPLEEARCPEDNAELEPLARDQARELVPAYVFETQASFRRCPVCGRVYWRATHWDRISNVRQAIGQAG